MTTKENFLLALQGEAHGWIADANVLHTVGGGRERFENGPARGGLDDFGVLWQPSASAAGQACPITHAPVLKDITQWKAVVHFPDVDALDWEGMAARQLEGIDRGRKFICYQTWNAQFLRITHLMGFEEALCAMYEEPEAWLELAEAITDYKIKLVEKAARYFRPDFFMPFDDVATERGLFMSAELYRKLIKPGHKRLNDAAIAFGMKPIIHCCGKCEEIMDDFMEEGFIAWSSSQPSNDIAAILKRTKGRFAVIGGYDTNGIPGRQDASDEQVAEEVRRCMTEYGIYPNYIFQGLRLMPLDGPVSFLDAMRFISNECKKYQTRG